ncbi:MAG: flagellar biosynthesis chaperone FliJ [Mariniblastus sp.]|jgi:flagellar biosynthesis chaperone FliJ
MNKLKSFQQVLSFYEQQLQIIQIKFQQQANVVAEKQHQAQQLADELANTQRQTSQVSPTASGLEMNNHVMRQIQTCIRANETEITEATHRLTECRAELAAKMSKIDALEKVIESETKKIAHNTRIVEQHLSDERYLNTHFIK